MTDGGKIIVTGGAGFIGSNIVRGLNARGIGDIIVVDDLTDGHKFENLSGLSIADYIDMERFREAIDRGLWSPRSNSAYDRLSALIEKPREAAE